MSTSKFNEFLPILLCGLSIPLSMFMWIGNVAFSFITNGQQSDEDVVITPMRWLFSVLVPLMLMLYGWKRKGVNKSGAAFGLIIAIILSIASHAFLASLATFYFSSSRATKFGSKKKQKIESDFKGGEGQRNWIQVLCNAGFAAQLALFYMLDCGSGERTIDFIKQYRSSWLGIGIMSSFACSNGDTWASELGTVVGSGDPFLITTRKRVPRGTNGGVSYPGLIFSFLGGLSIGLAYYLTVLYTVESHLLSSSARQWPIVLFGGIAGIIGSLIDSVIGATLQYSGQDKSGRIVERPGQNVIYISGYRILDNHSVNLISTILTGIIMPSVAYRFWP
ncbi:Transmembrane protein [Pseudolycoriella hygida]|uniref:Transmembrane protein 19 n=1 Tax=Pseudolycoriella hygida TaxID=35572 RepID=A0A9Q0NCV4_9DIPT|nr:Transmembrane protein [Pseudolycoriella hygida]